MIARAIATLALLITTPLVDAQAAPKSKPLNNAPSNGAGGNTAQSCGDATGMTASLFYVTCLGATSGNIEGNDADVAGLAGQFAGNWQFVQKFTFQPAGNFGTLTFSQAIKTRFILGVKAASYYSLYLYDGSRAPGGSDDEFWQTIGVAANNNNDGANISHLNLYVEPCTTNCGGGPDGEPVPEPASATLVGAGLLALGAAARRRRQNH